MISVIGAGPAGCYAAYLLAREGKEVDIYEEHKEIGKPLHCTGIVTSSLEKIIGLKNSFAVNKIDKARIFAPNGNFIELKLKNKNIILDRIKFDNYLADMAVKEGVRILLNHKFLDYKNKEAIIKDVKKNSIKKIKSDILIGADGPLSQVARAFYSGKRDFWAGVQVRAKIKNDNAVEFYPYIGEYAWLVPENKDIARIGLVGNSKVYDLFKNFLKIKNIGNSKIIEQYGGLIPKYNPKIKTERDNVFLVGDAAAQVKATTGGGIVQGLRAAGILADSILNNKNYDKEWKKRMGNDLWLHLKLRNILDKFSKKDWDYLIALLNKEKTRSILEKHDRDYPSRFLLELLLKEPRFLYFAKRIFF